MITVTLWLNADFNNEMKKINQYINKYYGQCKGKSEIVTFFKSVNLFIYLKI